MKSLGQTLAEVNENCDSIGYLAERRLSGTPGNRLVAGWCRCWLSASPGRRIVTVVQLVHCRTHSLIDSSTKLIAGLSLNTLIARSAYTGGLTKLERATTRHYGTAQVRVTDSARLASYSSRYFCAQCAATVSLGPYTALKIGRYVVRQNIGLQRTLNLVIITTETVTLLKKCVQPRPLQRAAAPLLLSAGACYRSISCPRGAQQETRLAAVDQWNRLITGGQTDAQPFNRLCFSRPCGQWRLFGFQASPSFTVRHYAKIVFAHLLIGRVVCRPIGLSS